MIRLRRLAGAVAAAAITMTLAAPGALAHEDREVTLPDGTGAVPEYRTEAEASDVLIVCGEDAADFAERIAGFPADLRQQNEGYFERCQQDGHTSIQAAVDAVTQPGTNIYLLPGVYLEEASRPEPAGDCAPSVFEDLGRLYSGDGSYQIFEFEDHIACPHNQNLIAIMGIEDLQIEGTGAEPGDVIVDAEYTKLNGIRGDRADGLYVKNFTAQQTTFNAIYVIQTDGFVIDDVVGRWNDEYGFLTFAVDHGLYTDCEAYGNGDSGIYPGSASDINTDREYEVDRYSVEITDCYSHHNLLGYSGTAGDSVWAHDNDFSDNTVGVAMDSLFPDHPGLPQNHALFENNLIYNNNEDYFDYVRDGTCAKPSAERGYQDGVVCPAIGVPVGTGIMTAGGNYNVYRDNHVYGNGYTGFFLLHPPAFIRNEMSFTKQWDTSNHNTYIGNTFGETPDGAASPNGLDVWWDGQGVKNCWQSDAGDSVPLRLPACGDEPGEFSGPQTARYFAEPATLASLYVCGEYSLSRANIPAGCEWFGSDGLERVDVQLTLVSSVLVGLAGLLVWWRQLRHSRVATIATGVGVIGLIMNVIVVPQWHTVLPAIAIALIGGWLAVLGIELLRAGTRGGAAEVIGGDGRASGRTRGFGWLTIVFGALALLHAVDKSIVMLPWIPLSPAWFRFFVGIVWVVWAVVISARRGGGSDQPADGAGSVDPAQEPASA